MSAAAGLAGEYPRLYARFASLCAEAKSEVDWLDEDTLFVANQESKPQRERLRWEGAWTHIASREQMLAQRGRVRHALEDRLEPGQIHDLVHEHVGVLGEVGEFGCVGRVA